MNALREPVIDSTGGYVYQFIMVVFIAPIIGEFVFRGFLLQRFAAKWGNEYSDHCSSDVVCIVTR